MRLALCSFSGKMFLQLYVVMFAGNFFGGEVTFGAIIIASYK